MNGLYDLDYSLNLSVLLAPHDHKWSHSHADGHVEFNCHSFFFCVQLAGWASHCAVCALAPTGSNKCLFWADHVKIHIGFLDIVGRIKGQYLFYFRSAENMSQTPI